MNETLQNKIQNLKIYIKTLHNLNKNNLNYIEQEFKKIYEDLQLFLVSKKDNYYGYILLNLKLKVDYYVNYIAGVNVSFSNYFIITINPFLFLELEVKEMLFIICHEIEHLVLNHLSEAKRINPNNIISINNKLNIAMDCSINTRLINEDFEFLKMPNPGITLKTIKEITKEKNIKNLESYLYYYNLIKDIDEDDINKNIKTFDLNNNLINDKVNLNIDNKKIITSKNYSKEIVHDWSDNNISDEEINSLTKEFIKKVNESILEKDKGKFPLYQIENLEKILAIPKINWKQVLKQYLGNIPIPYKKTKTRLSRREPFRFDLSGKIMDRTIKLVIAIDTSSSISNYELEKFMIEIFSIVKNKKHEITIIECDMEIEKIYKVKNITDVDLEIKGRGGTSFTPVINYINEHNYFRDAVLVYFTDGFGDSEIPKPKTYRNLWIVLKNAENLSLKNSYGKVMVLNEDE